MEELPRPKYMLGSSRSYVKHGGDIAVHTLSGIYIRLAMYWHQMDVLLLHICV